MKGTTERIFQAAIQLFINKGFQATTQEIAKEADVAEITLYRKYSTKQNLFNTVIKRVLEKQFNTRIMEMAKEPNTERFIKFILKDRLEIISRNILLVKMLISESLKGNLTGDVDFPVIIMESLESALSYHFNQQEKKVDTALMARQLAGIFLSQVVFPNEKPFYQLDDHTKEDVINRYVQSLIILV